MKELVVIIPAYNEEDIIDYVINDWHSKLNSLKINFKLVIYDDGSHDNTYSVIQKVAKEHVDIVAETKKNSGHGPTILKGYKHYVDNAKWIFQVDADNEMSAEYFNLLWDKRDEFDFLIGSRDNRQQPSSRKLVSLISRMIINFFYGSSIKDVNSPYRLMKSIKFKSLIFKIPNNTFAPNLIISGYVSLSNLKYYQIKIKHNDRVTGEVSIKKWKLFKAAFRSMLQTVKFRFYIFR